MTWGWVNKGILIWKWTNPLSSEFIGYQDWLPTEAKQGWAWSVPGWKTPEKTRLLLAEVLVRPAGGAHPVVCVGPNVPV